MAEPKAEIDLSAPFASVKAAVSMFGEKIPPKTHGQPHPSHLPHPPSQHQHQHQYLGSYHGPNHQAEKIFSLESELHRAHGEICKYKEQLASTEAAKFQALRELTETKSLLEQISHVEHFAASDNALIQTTSLPANFSDGNDWQAHLDAVLGQHPRGVVTSTQATGITANHSVEIGRIQKELESVKSHLSNVSAELENAKLENDRLQAEVAANTFGPELESAKKEINRLQAVVNAAWTQHGAFTTELAGAKEEIAGLESELRVARASSMELAHAKEAISVLRVDFEASSTELLKAREEFLKLRGQHGASMTELLNAQQEIDRLQGEQQNIIAELTNVKEEFDKLQTDLKLARGSSSTELTVAREEIGKLHTELESLRGQHGSSSKELLTAEEEIRKLRKELEATSTQHGDYASQLASAREEIERLQNELSASLQGSSERQDTSGTELLNSGNELTMAREQLNSLHTEHNTTLMELLREKEEVGRLQSELAAASRQFQDLREEIGRLQADLIVAQCTGPSTELFSAMEEIERLKVEVQHLTSSQALSSREVSNGDHAATLMDELTMELMATNEHLEKATAARMKAEKELADVREEALEASALSTELESIQAELRVSKEAERMLIGTKAEMEELRSQLAVTKENEEKAIKTAAEANAELDSLSSVLASIQEAEQNSTMLVDALQLEVEALKAELVALKESEEKTRGSFTATSAELEKVEAELWKVKEAEESASGIAASSAAELETLKAELAITKEGEARAKAAFSDYSLKLQRMRIELEDATKIADKARAYKLDLDEVHANLKKVTESERTMSASMASLRAELKNARTDLVVAREEGEAALTEKDEQIEMEITQMRVEWEAAVSEEAKLKERVSTLNESLTKLTTEAEEAKSASALAKEAASIAKQELEQSLAHVRTLESKLRAAILEVEAVKASEERALSQVKSRSQNADEGQIRESGADIPISHDEYESLTRKTQEVEELANKRVAMAMAQVDAAKASEKEMQSKLELAKKDLEFSRADLREATKKREEAESAKFAVEGMLRNYRGERRPQAFNGGGPPTGSPISGDRQGYTISPTQGNSQNSSPLHPSFSFATFASPGSHEKPSTESLAQALATRIPSEEKQRRARFSSKIGSYFVKKKETGAK